MVGKLVPGPEGIGHGDVEVRPVERQVVVPTVPEKDVALLLGLLEDRAVVDARVYDRAGLDVRSYSSRSSIVTCARSRSSNVSKRCTRSATRSPYGIG